MREASVHMHRDFDVHIITHLSFSQLVVHKVFYFDISKFCGKPDSYNVARYRRVVQSSIEESIG